MVREGWIMLVQFALEVYITLGKLLASKLVIVVQQQLALTLH